jgi:hypothetical protein
MENVISQILKMLVHTQVFNYSMILVTMFNISVDEYFYPTEKVAKSTARRQIETALDLLSDNELKIIQGTIDGILESRESEK